MKGKQEVTLGTEDENKIYTEKRKENKSKTDKRNS